MKDRSQDASKVISLNQSKNREVPGEREVKGGTASQGKILGALFLNTLGSSFAIPVETSRRQLGRQVWNLGASSELKTARRESSEMVFIATRLADITPGGHVDGEVLDWALGLSDE